MENALERRRSKPVRRQSLREPKQQGRNERAEQNGREQIKQNFADFFQAPDIKSRRIVTEIRIYSPMHNEHAWKEKTADGGKREVRATKFGGVWRIQAKL